MLIGGLQKFSTLDYEGNLSAIVFTQGCNFRCQFCYNPMLVLPIEDAQELYQKNHSLISENDFFDFLRQRQGKLDAVVVTGGEPTLHNDLPEFMRKIKDLGYLIKLDSNGTNPERLKQVLDMGLVDYFAMDLKATESKYKNVVGVEVDFSKIMESVRIIMNSGIQYEFRTTVVPGLLLKEDILAMSEIIKGANKWYLQKFQSDHDLVNRGLQGAKSYSFKDLEEMAVICSQKVKLCKVR